MALQNSFKDILLNSKGRHLDTYKLPESAFIDKNLVSRADIFY